MVRIWVKLLEYGYNVLQIGKIWLECEYGCNGFNGLLMITSENMQNQKFLNLFIDIVKNQVNLEWNGLDGNGMDKMGEQSNGCISLIMWKVICENEANRGDFDQSRKEEEEEKVTYRVSLQS